MSSGKKLDEYLSQGRGSRRLGGSPITPSPSELREIKEKLRVIEAKVSILEDLLSEALETLKSIEAKLKRLEEAQMRQRPGRSGSSTFREYLEREGVILVSESKQKLGVSPQRAVSLARGLEAFVLDLEGDADIMTESTYREFLEKLSTVKTSDPEEAARMLGKYSRIFLLLRRKGDVYYDSRRRRWKLIAEP